MSLLQLNHTRLSTAVFISTGLFAAAVFLYFIPVEVPFKTAVPLAVLTVASLWLTPAEISLAMFFSTIGDLSGSEGWFLAQMGAFAVAQICMTVFFIRRYRTRVGRDKGLTAKMKGYVMTVVILTLALLGFVCAKIVPETPAGIIRIGTVIYACLICCMLVCALIQRSTLYASGAILFVFSDFILAWDMFTEAVPHACLLVMIPYYIGQWMLFVRSTPYRIPGLRTHRM